MLKWSPSENSLALALPVFPLKTLLAFFFFFFFVDQFYYSWNLETFEHGRKPVGFQVIVLQAFTLLSARLWPDVRYLCSLTLRPLLAAIGSRDKRCESPWWGRTRRSPHPLCWWPHTPNKTFLSSPKEAAFTSLSLLPPCFSKVWSLAEAYLRACSRDALQEVQLLSQEPFFRWR